MLSEIIYQATNFKVVLLQDNKVKQAAKFGANIEIINDVYRPCDFGTALITFDSWKQSSPSSLIVYDSEKALQVDIKVTGADFEIQPETIQENVSARKQPTRLGINLTRPVTYALVSLTITPKE
ncbi:MAG: hypothetical protein ABIL62_01320 [Planctomycetota bacterium]